MVEPDKNTAFCEHFKGDKVFASTSEAKGYPNTFIQACKCGTAILSFAVDTDGFMESCACGLCCNGDSSRLTYNLRFMLEDNQYAEYGSNGRRYAEQYHDITKIAAEYKFLFARLAESR